MFSTIFQIVFFFFLYNTCFSFFFHLWIFFRMIGFFFSIDFHYLNFKLLKPWDKKVQKKKKKHIHPRKGILIVVMWWWYFGPVVVCLFLFCFKINCSVVLQATSYPRLDVENIGLLKANEQPMENWMWPQWLQLN